MTFKLLKFGATFTAIAVLAGCATQGPKPQALQDVIAKQTQLQQDQRISTNAGIELNELGEYINRADKAWQEGEGETYEQQLYLASRQSDIAESTGLAQHFRDQVEEMAEKRQQLLLQAKDAELAKTRNRLESTRTALQDTESELSETKNVLTTKSQQLEKLTTIAESAEQQAIALADELTSVKAEMTNRGMVLTLQDILFEFGKSDLKPGADRTIEKVAEFLDENPKVVVTIEGFTDSVGSEQYNLKLSEQRADSVMQALVRNNVSTDRMETKALGESFPVASNDTAEGRQENRRVELVLNQSEE